MKWHMPQRNVKAGDLVLMVSESSHRSDWPKAVVESVHPGNDDVVRTVIVRTSNGRKYNRDIRKLVLLESAPDDCQPSPITPVIQGQSWVSAEVEAERPDRSAGVDDNVENITDCIDSVAKSISNPTKGRKKNPYNVDLPLEPRRSQRIAGRKS